MKEFGDQVLALPLGITHAMHAEAAPKRAFRSARVI